MENKLSPKESHVWTLSDFIERRKDWDQKDEARLAEYLQQLSNKITHGAKNTLNELSDLVASIDDTAVQIANINNEFQLLADKQFIENKVQEEDETVKTKVEKPVVHKINNDDALVNNLKEALKNSFIAINTHFEKVTVAVSDSDDDDEIQHEETVLRPRTFYKKLNLPSLNGNTQTDIAVDIVMSSDSDSEVDELINTLKDKESSSSNDVPQEDIHSIIESKIIHEPNPQPVDTYSNIFESEKLKSNNVPTYADNSDDDLFSPPPLINDDDEDDLDNGYNIFGNSSNNMFGERNLWDDNDDDNSNEPPLPIYSDEPPPQFIKSNTQEKVEVPSIQQSLNDELRKRFNKDNISSSSDNVIAESTKIKLPKGAVNIIGKTVIKPSSTQTKQAKISEISKNVAQDINKDLNFSNTLFNDSNQNPVTSTQKDFKKETKSIKNDLFFDQDSDEDLFAKKTSNVISSIKPEIEKEKENSSKNVKLSRPIFSNSDSDEEFFNSKSPTTKEIASNSIINNSTTKLLDSSSDDDLFNIKPSNNKSILKQKNTFSSQIHDTVVNKSNQIKNEIKQNSKFPIEEESAIEILNEKIINESKKNSEGFSINATNAVTRKEFSPNNNTLDSNIIEPPSMNNTRIQSTKKSLSSPSANKFSNFFSSDEDDDIFLNVSELNKKNTKKDQVISNVNKLVKNRNEDVYRSKVEIFDSSSDDDIFNTNKSNNLIPTKNSKQADSKEIKTEESQPNNNCALINHVQKTEHLDKINVIENTIKDKKNTNIFNLLSDDEDENYFSFNNISDSSMNLSNSQNVNENIKSMSSSSEEFLSPQIDTKNEFFQTSSPESSLDSKVQESFNKREIDKPKNEILNISKDKKFNNKISSIFSDHEDEQQLSLNSNIKIENSKTESKVITSSSNSLLNDCKNQESFDEKEQIDTSKNQKYPSSTKTKVEDIKSFTLSNSDNQHQLLFNSNNLNESSTKKIEVISPILDFNTSSKDSIKDSTDGSSFSSLNSKNETVKKLPGKLSKNAGAFINIASLLPNSKMPLKTSDIPRSASLDEYNDDNLPTVGTKLFSVEKERAKLQVKRRPQSRKARLAAARMSSIDIDHDPIIQESSRLFSSTSDLIDYQSSPILNDNVSDSLNIVQNVIQEPLNSIIDNKTEKNNEAKKNIMDLFDDDSNLFESRQEEITRIDYCTNNEQAFCENQFESKSVNKQLPEIESVHQKLLKAESSNKKQSEIETINEKQQEIESIHNKKDKSENVIEIEENKSTSITKNTMLPKTSISLFDDDHDDIFSSKSEKVKKSSSNIFDSDDEFEFNQKFTKKTSIKTNSIFGDDSDDDLFSSSSKPSTSNLNSQKPIDKISQRQNRPCVDGYVKLTAESVAINPLESKKN